MKIGLIGLDGKLPNLALMKLSTYWQGQGAQVFLNDAVPRDADRVYVSVIFAKNRRKAEALRTHFTGEVLFGGTGWDLTTVLPDEIEACPSGFCAVQCGRDRATPSGGDRQPREKAGQGRADRHRRARLFEPGVRPEPVRLPLLRGPVQGGAAQEGGRSRRAHQSGQQPADPSGQQSHGGPGRRGRPRAISVAAHIRLLLQVVLSVLQ